jgi:hypothetical protein
MAERVTLVVLASRLHEHLDVVRAQGRKAKRKFLVTETGKEAPDRRAMEAHRRSDEPTDVGQVRRVVRNDGVLETTNRRGLKESTVLAEKAGERADRRHDSMILGARPRALLQRLAKDTRDIANTQAPQLRVNGHGPTKM